MSLCVYIDVSTHICLLSFHISMQRRNAGREANLSPRSQNPTLGQGQEIRASATALFPAQLPPSTSSPPFLGGNCFYYWHTSPTRCLQFTTRCHRFPTHCHQFVTYFSQLSAHRDPLLKKQICRRRLFTLNIHLNNHRKTKCKNNHLKSQSCISGVGPRWLYSEITNSLVCCMHNSNNPSLRQKISS